jgi:hypothetical protein
MPWPERDLRTRLLAAGVVAPFGAFLGFLLGAGPFRSLNYGHPPLLAFTLGVMALVSLASFWFGDPALRFLLRLISGWRPPLQ